MAIDTDREILRGIGKGLSYGVAIDAGIIGTKAFEGTLEDLDSTLLGLILLGSAVIGTALRRRS